MDAVIDLPAINNYHSNDWEAIAKKHDAHLRMTKHKGHKPAATPMTS